MNFLDKIRSLARASDGEAEERHVWHANPPPPRTWEDPVKKEMTGLFFASERYLAGYRHRSRQITVVVRLGDFLGVGSAKGLECLFREHARGGQWSGREVLEQGAAQRERAKKRGRC